MFSSVVCLFKDVFLPVFVENSQPMSSVSCDEPTKISWPVPGLWGAVASLRYFFVGQCL